MAKKQKKVETAEQIIRDVCGSKKKRKVRNVAK